MENNHVTYKALTKGQMIKGAKDGNRTSIFTGYVKDINPSFVTISMWSKDGKEEKFSTHLLFAVEMTEREFNCKYREKAKEVIKNIQNKLYKSQIGSHDMWNSWLFGTPYEIACECIKEKITIVGYCDDIIAKHNLFSGEPMDIAVCAEYEDGDRFWCHYSTKMLNDLLEWAKIDNLL